MEFRIITVTQTAIIIFLAVMYYVVLRRARAAGAGRLSPRLTPAIVVAYSLAAVSLLFTMFSLLTR